MGVSLGNEKERDNMRLTGTDAKNSLLSIDDLTLSATDGTALARNT